MFSILDSLEFGLHVDILGNADIEFDIFKGDSNT